jgi:alanine racemase
VKIRGVLSGNPTGAPSGLAPDEPHLAVREVDIRTSIRPTVAEVDLGALRRNVARMRAMVGPRVALYGVVKADAYGHGAVAVGRVRAPLCDGLAVSLVEEGLELREAGIGGPVLVLGAYYDRYQSEVLEEGLTPVVYQAADLQRFAEAPVRRRRPTPSGTKAGPLDVHVKINTGMNRLGVAVDELPGLLERAAGLSRVRVAGLCTHLASADMSEEEPTRTQLALFERCLASARGQGTYLAHAANSAAAVRFPEARFDAVRPGLALYGAMPSAVVARQELEPVLSLRSRIMALHDVPVGGAVSYGGIWRAGRPSRVATLPLGYADGYPRHVRGAEVLVRGRRAPVVGAVCMDMLMVDVTDVPGASVSDAVTLVGVDGGEAISVDDLARWAGTVNYEILCGLSKRVPRHYRDDAPEAT